MSRYPHYPPRVLVYICMDNALDSRIHRTAVMIEKSADYLIESEVLAFFGPRVERLHDGRNLTRAQIGYHFARDYAEHGTLYEKSLFRSKTQIDVNDDAELNSRLAICHAIVWKYLRQGYKVTLCLNGFAAPLTRHLIRREAIRAGLNWTRVKPNYGIIMCGGTFAYNFRSLRPRGIAPFTWWLSRVLGNEIRELAISLFTTMPEAPPPAD